ncbi:MAG: DUF2207 domain-containing protein [Bacteroidales bacterium]|nr:DUF2207 domain-containing protein [Bacteroidales bacterium]
MKRLFAAVLALVLAAGAEAQRIRDIDIAVLVRADGSADVLQEWDVNVVRGTEWYVPIENLGEVRISDLTVSENGQGFVREGVGWDSDRSASAKAGRCGIIEKRNGVELCWGQGDYGDHKWTVTYHIDGLVQGFTDGYSGFNWQFVNPGMIAGPEHVRVRILNATEGQAWSFDNTRIWGFGTNAGITINDKGVIVAETNEGMSRSGYINIMVRFDEGLFSDLRIQRKDTFQDLRDVAQKGATYSDDEDEDLGFIGWAVVIGLLLCGVGVIVAILWVVVSVLLGNKWSKSLFGERKIKGWFREAPLEGNLPAAWFVVKNGPRFGYTGDSGRLVGAYFLRWIISGAVTVQPDPKRPKRVNLALAADPADFEGSEGEKKLYRMVYEAAGSNHLLEKNEFQVWARKHYHTAENWPQTVAGEGRSFLIGKKWLLKGTDATEEGKPKMRQVVEFKNFLTDFTLAAERGAVESKLWKDYLVYAQLFGVADKVASEFKKLYPAEFEQFSQSNLSGVDIITIVAWNNMISHSFASAAASAASASSSRGSRGGFGGGFSVGGGGGFSGGGFGGGSR